MRPWLARLTFSFLIIAAFLFWTGYKAMAGRLGPIETWKIALYFLAGGMSLALFIAGLRARHGPED
jgi:hypothetical protein